MSTNVFDGFEKMNKKQNKEQVPPPAEPQHKKPASSKPKTSTPAPTSTQHKTVEDAFKAVSNTYRKE